jgi:hypothetical protein
VSEPRPLPPLPRPFAVEPRRLRGGAGCSRGALIGCGVLVVLFGIGTVALSTRATQISVWLLRKLEARITAELPAEVRPVERQRLQQAFADLYAAMASGSVEPAALQELQRRLWTLAGEVERGLTREQVRELTAALERAAGGGAALQAAPTAGPAAR